MGYNVQFLPATALSASITSPPFQKIGASNYSVQAVFSGSTCEFGAKLQVSSDPYDNTVGFVPPNWDDVADSAQTIAQAGSFTWDVGPSAPVWVRLVITDNSSGSNNGNISAIANIL